jgi:tetratricopeptide (TPR) repeat protein
MGIQVHSEVAQYGTVVDTNCIRCLTCKDACPNGTLGYKWGSNVISITRKIKWLIPKKSNYCWYYELILIFCGLIVAYFTQMWLGSFQTFLGAAWGLCFGMLIIRLLESKSISLKEITLYREKFLIVSLVTLCTLAWCWITNTPHDARLLLRGNRFMDLMEYDKAISIYNQALNEGSSNNEIRATLALAYKTKGDYNRSITEYKILINNNPDNAALHNNLGTVYYRKGDYDLAIEEYKKSIRLDTHLTAAYGNIGLIFLEKGSIEEAITYLRKVFQNEDEMLEYLFEFYKPKQDLKG